MHLYAMRLPALLLVLASACTVEPPTTEIVSQDPNAGLLRDFLDGKFDSAGHPVNARVTEAESLCPDAGVPHNGAIRLSNNKTCSGTLSGSEQNGDLVASMRLSIKAHPASGTIVSAAIVRTDGEIIANTTLTTSRLRDATWVDLPMTWASSGQAVTVRIQPAPGAIVDVDYVEVFPERFGLVATPGSGTFSDTDHLVFELPKSRKLDRVELDGADITERLTQLIIDGKAKRTRPRIARSSKSRSLTSRPSAWTRRSSSSAPVRWPRASSSVAMRRRASSKAIRTASKCSSPVSNRSPPMAGTTTSRASPLPRSIRRTCAAPK